MHENRTYVVTGAASGIGAETVRVLRSLGARVIGIDRQETKDVDQFVEADLSNHKSLMNAVVQMPTGIDGLANIAGVPPTLAAETVLRVNTIGLRQLTKALIPKMSDGANIVNLASLAGNGWADNLDQVRRTLTLTLDDDVAQFCTDEELNNADGQSYFLSKQALIVWTMQNRWTWRDRDINMNCISPGPVATPILADFVETLGERVEEDMKVMDRAAEVTDIAPVVSFALSSGAKWLRGTNIETDGGMKRHILAQAHAI